MNKEEKMNQICTICPRNCNVNRANHKLGVCGQTDEIKIARAALHMWEEPCVSGKNGSGTIFFTGCNLRCIFCQNREIATSKVGKIVSLERLEEIFYELKDKGANNINLVTPSHFLMQLVPLLKKVKSDGYKLPIVYNTSSYEKVEALRELEGLVDIYLPDLKYKDVALSEGYSNAKDYFEVALPAIEEMVRQVGQPLFYSLDKREYLTAMEYNERCDEEEIIMKRGVIVRHLILPGSTKDSMEVLKEIYNRFGNQVFLSIMNQYTPFAHIVTYPNLNRKVSKREYEKVVSYALSIGIENAFVQGENTAKESFIPDFNMEGI